MKKLQTAFFQQVKDITQILQVLERIPGTMFMIKNLDSRYIYISRALREAINLHPGDDGIGKTDFDLFPKIIAQNFHQNDQPVFKHGKSLIDEVHATCFIAHPPYWHFSSKYPLRNRAGKVVGLIGIARLYDDVMGQEAELNRMLPAIEHISKNYAETITVSQLARLCSFSKNHFMRIFNARMKMTAHAFVEQVRMFHALDAIKHKATSITEIALSCGFYDHSAFVKRFKKFTGTTPLRCRRDHQTKLKPDRGIVLSELTGWD